jgi:membrane fusion protein (multidrug efflux system)
VTKNRKLIIGIVAAVLVVLGTYFGYQHFTYVTTDNAQVSAHFTMLSPRVSGTITAVHVEENQNVKAGDVLAEFDPADFQNALDAAKAQVASLGARFHEAEVNYKRAQDLFKKQAIAQERFDSAQASYQEVTARLKVAQSQADQAELNLKYTKIVAPEDGKIARKSAEIGQFAAMGQPLFGFVAANERWVIANLKETELEGVKTGSHAYIEVDAVSGKTYEGEVESVSPSTGALFSLLPPDNATGNFTKVVQRVPVKIKLSKLNSQDMDKLQAGLSAVVSIRIRN